MAKIPFEPPYYPIIYVRGYAGSQGEVEDTVADPYMGFNVGATKLRQAWQGEIQRLYFESPLVRMMKDYGYRDVYTQGAEMPPELAVQPRSLFVFRYYDQASQHLGSGKPPEIEDSARDLGELILRIRDRVCADCQQPPEAFRVYLVAHSMGGLICRCLLQHGGLGEKAAAARPLVDKVFTYATPHNGIDLQAIGNIPGFFSRNNVDNFNRQRMATYLGLPDGSERVDDLDGKFDPRRFFCLVGTNASDYDVAGGLARRVVGPLSDGLVRIDNAAVKNAPRAFVHRSHSGHFGIVNSEEGFQNLTRFLFGNVQVDGLLQVDELTLPPKVEQAWKKDSKVRASYHFEVVVKVRGARWDLHRRLVSENCAIFRTFEEMFERPEDERRHPYLFSQFLSPGARVNTRRRSLGFSIDLGVQVPEYEINGRLWFDDFYEGGYLYRDKINLEAIPPTADNELWRLRYGFDSSTPNRTSHEAETLPADQTPSATRAQPGDLVFRIPIVQPTRPGIRAQLILRARPVG